MSYIQSDLSILAYANNFTLWHYVTNDRSVAACGYFNSAREMLRINDLIIVNEATDGTQSTIYYIVTGNNGTNVVVTPYHDQIPGAQVKSEAA